ncbi:MAG: cell shape determination protein CcmA [Alphaproteobacteria bacterium]|nr:cell shape determination protein CcmA [Alphaproteobacteria bacterium]
MNLSSRPRRTSSSRPAPSDEGSFTVSNVDDPTPTAGEQPVFSVIGADIVVTGSIEASVDLHIDGRVEGDVRCKTLILGEASAITGNVFADRVRAAGIVTGSIETNDLAIEASARVSGDVLYERIRITNGAQIDGNLKCKTSAAALKTRRSKATEA